MKKRVMLPLMLCLALALAFGVTACGGTGDSGNGGGGATEAKPAHVVYYVAGNEAATGTAPKPAAVTEGATFTAAENTFTLEGYTFVGWSDGSKTYAAGDTGTMGTADVVLTAQWTDATYAVTYAAGDGTGTAPVQAAVAEGGTFTLADNTFTAPAGYVFGGWTDGTAEYAAGDTYTMGGAAVTITAVWDKVYTLGEGETLKASLSTVTVEANDDGSITVIKSVFDLETFQQVPTPIGTYTYSVVGDTAEFTQVVTEGEPETYTGSNYGGIVRITLPDETVTYGEPETDFMFFFPGVDVADYTGTPTGAVSYWDVTSPDAYTIYCYNNDYMYISLQGGGGNLWGETVGYDETTGLFTYRLFGEDEAVTVKFVREAYATIFYLNDGLAGTYVTGDRTVVVDGYRSCTINNVAGSYEPLDGDKYYVADVDGDDSFTAVFDPETGTMTVGEITTMMCSSVSIDGEAQSDTSAAQFTALFTDGETLFFIGTDDMTFEPANIAFIKTTSAYLYQGGHMGADNTYYEDVYVVSQNWQTGGYTVTAYMTNSKDGTLTVQVEEYAAPQAA